MLDGEFSLEETMLAVIFLPADKSPDPDSFSVFTKLSGRLSNLTCFKFLIIYIRVKQACRELITLTIVLVSKLEGANLVSQFRPISLFNCSFKIIMKALANRLRNVIGLMVDNAQSGFIRNRFILENVAIVQGIISETHFNKREGIILQLDFKKAYNKVNWVFFIRPSES